MVKIKSISPTIKVLAVPIVTIISSLLLAFFIVRIGYPKVINGMRGIQDSKKERNTLEQRLEVLQEFNKAVLQDQSDIVFSVLPNGNFGAAALSQVKSLASSEGLVLEQVSSIGGVELFQPGVKKTDINYEFFSNDIFPVVRFLVGLTKVAPINSIQEVDIARAEDGIHTKLKASIFWSELPSKLPSLNEPVTELSEKDRETLRIVQGYKLPQFEDLPPQSKNQNRENPFN